jgi:hypothetical protein
VTQIAPGATVRPKWVETPRTPSSATALGPCSGQCHHPPETQVPFARRLRSANVRRPEAIRCSSMPSEPVPPILHGACHCGAVRLTLPRAPEKATSCNCSLCRRTGALWAYYEYGTVVVEGHPGNTEAYIWGDRTLKTVRCKSCGIVTHWEPLDPEPGARQGVNLCNFDPTLLESVVVRRFDGADFWTFLD